MNKQDILDILQAAAEYDKPLAIHIHITADGATVTPAPAPAPTPAAVRYRVQAPADKQSGRVKLRSSPSPAADGMAIKTGETVTLVGGLDGFARDDVVYLNVSYTGSVGWIEAAYLERI